MYIGCTARWPLATIPTLLVKKGKASDSNAGSSILARLRLRKKLILNEVFTISAVSETNK